ncbi:MAG TPA: fibronectin type III-like domain-contianing protein, partial [Polyangiaceae bacterium]
KGFARVAIEAGQKRHVEFTLDARAFVHFSPERKRFEVEPGPLELRVGRSSADILQMTTVSLTD